MEPVNNSNKVFEDTKINVKLKISALWVAIMFCYLYGDYIEIYVPGVLADAMQVTQATVKVQIEFLAVAILMVIPSLMVFLSLVLAPAFNRWLNTIIPALYIFLLIFLNLETGWIFYLFLTVVEILISVATIFYAWKWPLLEA